MDCSYVEYLELKKRLKAVEKQNPKYRRKKYAKSNNDKQKIKVQCPCCNKEFTKSYFFLHKRTKHYTEWINTQNVISPPVVE